jgi:hypothetical protein
MNRTAAAVHAGDTIHIRPHCVFRNSTAPVPTQHCPDAEIVVDAVIREDGWDVVLICWHRGSAHCATTYDADQPIELVRGAA